MRTRSQIRASLQGLLKWGRRAAFVACACALPAAEDFASLCADRAAIERVHYNHRTGAKPPFEETLPADALRRLVQADLAKESALRSVYGVAVTPAMLTAEVQRINATTRAPEILTELKAALGHDPDRFAHTIAKPILVERLLRARFENDDALHAAQRQEAEKVRARLMSARSSRREEAPSENSEIRNPKPETNPSLESGEQEPGSVGNLVGILKKAGVGQFTESIWQLGARAPETNAAAADEIEIKKRFGPAAQILSPPRGADEDRQTYFEDLSPDLRRVLRAQLRQPGDVSAVIEHPGGFLLYVCRDRTDTILSVACLSLPKRSYEQWLDEQKEIP